MVAVPCQKSLASMSGLRRQHARGPLFQTTWSARAIFSVSGIWAAIICSAADRSREERVMSRCSWMRGEQATTTTRSQKVSPPVS